VTRSSRAFPPVHVVGHVTDETARALVLVAGAFAGWLPKSGILERRALHDGRAELVLEGATARRHGILG
jgi:hypothetical protein